MIIGPQFKSHIEASAVASCPCLKKPDNSDYRPPLSTSGIKQRITTYQLYLFSAKQSRRESIGSGRTSGVIKAHQNVLSPEKQKSLS